MLRLRLIVFALALGVSPAVAQEPPERVRLPVPLPEAPRVWLPEITEMDLWLDFEFPQLAELEWQLADAALAQRQAIELWRLEDQVALATDAFVGAQAVELALADQWNVSAQVELARDAFEQAKLGLELADLPVAGWTSRALPSEPPESWAPDDQADSLYKQARQALNRGNYHQAAELFRMLPERYPQSKYAADAPYWEAFARYRMGATDELRTALEALERQRARYAQAATRADAAALATRIRGALAARGDIEAAALLEREAGQGATTCDEEETAVRVEALNALAAMDPSASRELFTRVLARRDECSAALRRRVVFLLAREADSTAAALVIGVAQSDPDPEVRAYALRWLARVPGEAALATLENAARANDDLSVQRAAVRALATHPDPRARGALRAVIQDPEAPERVRTDAIAAFAREEATPQDVAWLRSVYPRLETPRLKSRVISTVRRHEGAENEQWLLELARNPAEPVDLRGAAISGLSRRETVAIGQLVVLYDSMTERRLREQLISAYGRREEPEATDKLIEIVRTGTDPRLRRNAISALTRKKDPRTARLLMELIDQ